jgi:hypothetical protein
MLMEEQRLRLKLAMVMEDVLLHPVMHQHHSLQVVDQLQGIVQLIFVQMVLQLWMVVVWLLLV